MRIARDDRPALEVRDLELVMALADAGSTVRAASRLHLTQSAVSRGLLAVEDKLGARLFDRLPRGLAPTAAGRRLLGGAGAVLAQLAELEHQARADSGRRAPLRLACECYTAYRWLPSALAALRRGSAAGALDVTLAFEHAGAPAAALIAGELDVALLTTARVPATLAERPLFSDEIIFLLGANHPLAQRAALGPDDLRAFPLITSTSTPVAEARWFQGRVFGRSPPRTQHVRFPLTEAIVDAARAGLGIAILSEWIASTYLGGGDLVVKRLRGRPLRRPWRIAYRREAAEAAEQLATALGGAPPRIYR